MKIETVIHYIQNEVGHLFEYFTKYFGICNGADISFTLLLFTLLSLVIFLLFLKRSAIIKSGNMSTLDRIILPIIFRKYNLGEKYGGNFKMMLPTEIVVGSEDRVGTNERTGFQQAYYRVKELTLYSFIYPVLWIIWMYFGMLWELDDMMQTGNQFLIKVIKQYRVKSISEQMEAENVHDFVETICGENTNPKEFEVIPVLENLCKTEIMGDKQLEWMVENMIKAGLTDKEIKDEVNMFMAADDETVATAMEFLIFCLACNNEVQEKCRLEISQLMNSHKYAKNESISLKDLHELKYLDRCILESLRLTATVPAFVRRLNDLNVNKENAIESEQCAVIYPCAVHQNCDIYPNHDAEIFDPDRFLPENVKNRQSFSFIPFSMGIRNCIRWAIALMEMKVFTCWILRYFDITTTHKQNDVRLFYDVIVNPERNFDLQFKTRK